MSMPISTKSLTPAIRMVLTTALFLFALLALHHVLGEFTWSDVRAELGLLDATTIALSILATFASYALLTVFDWIGTRLSAKSVPISSLMQTAFIANALGHNLGMAALTGGSVRLRAYSEHGLDAVEIGHIIAAASFGFLLGGLFWLGVALCNESAYASQAMQVPESILRIIGPGLLLGLTGLMLFLAFGKRAVTIGKRSIRFPAWRDGLLMLVVSIAELACAAAALYVLLPEQAAVGYLAFIGLYVIAVFAGVVSTVPGGLGVFEASMIVLLPTVPAHQVLATILAYRGIYYVLPLISALLLLVIRALREHAQVLARDIASTQRWTTPLVAPAFSLLVFVAGAALILNGSLPLQLKGADTLGVPVALPILEISHLAASALGVALLILARGVYQRIRLAWWLSIFGLSLAVILTLVVGLRWPLSLALLVLLTVLWSARRRFNRDAALFDLVGSSAWLRDVILVIGASVWLGFLVHRDVAYANELWWQFAFESDAPRMLRATLLSVLMLLVVGLMGVLKPRGVSRRVATDEERDRAAEIISHYGNTNANLALIPDKQLMFAEHDAGFLMYQRSGSCLIALGDPIGNAQARAALAWRFRELADRNGLRTVFYQVSEAQLPTYLDMGLTLSKLGEEAFVPLLEFSLEGSMRAELRQEHRRSVREGAEFAVLAPSEVMPHMSRLREISEQWLEDKQTAEKGFSLGYFDETYLMRFACAVVKHHGEIIAFANILTTSDRREFSVDLMRYVGGGPRRTMDYLFIELMLWGKQAGYREFSLGMAPLAGMSAHELAPIWHKLGNFAWHHGERFYNFEGLRHYKNKFAPEWRPRYLASPGGFSIAQAMFHVSRLIAGGTRQLFSH